MAMADITSSDLTDRTLLKKPMHAATLDRITAALALGDRGPLALNPRLQDHDDLAGNPTLLAQTSETIGFFGPSGRLDG